MLHMLKPCFRTCLVLGSSPFFSLRCCKRFGSENLFRSGINSYGGCGIKSQQRKGTPCFLAPIINPRRHKSYNFYINLENHEDTRRCVEEDLDRLEEENRGETTAYLHSLLNLALSHYQAQDYVKARCVAEYTHQRALQHNSNSSFIFFTAKTCSRCAAALADKYERHLRLMENRAEMTSTLAPKPSVVFGARRTIQKLQQDATRFDKIAVRVYNRPDLAFMRGYYSAAHCGDSKTEHSESACPRDEEQNPFSNDRRRTWSEDEFFVDEAFETQYGPKSQEKRRRPEHTEFRRYYQRQQQSSQDNRWKIPK